jgi:Ribbon-helix-helix domain
MPMSRRFHLILSDAQYADLSTASERTSLSIAELIRRALEDKYPALASTPSRREFTFSLWRQRAAPGNGRRTGLRLD